MSHLSIRCQCYQVSSQPEVAHLESSLVGKPFPVDELGPCPPSNNGQRLETVKCVMDAEKNADPTLGEGPFSDKTAIALFLAAVAQ